MIKLYYKISIRRINTSLITISKYIKLPFKYLLTNYFYLFYYVDI